MKEKRYRNILSSIIVMLMAFVLAAAVFAQEVPLVNSIEVRGLKRIEEGAVKSKISQITGEPVSNEKTAEDIRNIFKMGYFDDVRIGLEPFEGGVRLIYEVKEKATIIRIDFQGNSELKDTKLKEKLAVTVGSISDTTLIQDNADKIRKYYEEEGYWLATVVPVINKVRGSEVALTYLIEEGQKVRIKNINIEGNKNLSEGKIKRAMKTSKWRLYSFITSGGYYKKDVMASDLEAIKNLYYDNGYIKAAVAEPVMQLTEDKKGMDITIQVSEGEQYNIASIKLTGNKAFSEAELRKKPELLAGAAFSKETLRKEITDMTDYYTEHGYALANIYPEVLPDEASRQAGITFRVEEGDIYTMGRIEISGNTKTRDNVIRREVRFDEGDIFNSALLKRSYEKVSNLNFFETVDMVPKPNIEDKVVDLDVKVKERTTGFISIGGGYSSTDQLVGMLDITQGNLFGRGQYIKFKAELGGRTSLYEISFREPWFMNKPFSFTADIYKTSVTYIDYKKKATGFGFGFGKRFSDYLSGNISYNFEKALITDVISTASYLVKAQEGSRTTSSISPSIVRDTTDSRLDPSTGSRNSIYGTFAGLGGTNAFIKGVADSVWFFPVRSSTISLRGRVGYATGIFGKDLPLYERFYVGGINSVRGLGFGEGGPKDSSGNLIGGTKELIFNTEFIFPISKDLKLKGVTFFDAGNSYDTTESMGSLRYTAGVGARWISPMGPLRIEWGYNIQKRTGEQASRVEFTFGSFF